MSNTGFRSLCYSLGVIIMGINQYNMTQQRTDKQSFVIYNSFLEAANNLPDADFKKCIMSIRDYALYGIDEDTDNWAINVILSMAKPLLASARKRYENCVENGSKGKDFGPEGGRPKKYTSETKPQAKPQAKPQSQPLNDNDNVNNNVYTKAYADSNAENTNHLHKSFNNPSSNIVDSLQLNDEAEIQQPLGDKTKDLHDEFLRYLFKQAPNEMDELEYYEFWLADAIYKLVRMDDGALTKDDNLFFEAVKYYMLVYKVKDRNKAIKDINQLKRIVKSKIEAYENEIRRKFDSGS